MPDTGEGEGAKNRVATTAATWTAWDLYSKPRRPPALERGAASLSLRQARDETWALQPRSGPTDAARKAAGLPQGSTLYPSERRKERWAALGGLTRPTRASRGSWSATGRLAPQDTPGRLAASCRPQPTRGSHPTPSLEELVGLAGCYSRCLVSRPQARG